MSIFEPIMYIPWAEACNLHHVTALRGGSDRGGQKYSADMDVG